MKRSAVLARAFAICALSLAALPASAQNREMGAIQEGGFFGRMTAPDEFKIVHGSEFKGAQKVAISVFNVAFPNENRNTSVNRLGQFRVGR